MMGLLAGVGSVRTGHVEEFWFAGCWSGVGFFCGESFCGGGADSVASSLIFPRIGYLVFVSPVASCYPGASLGFQGFFQFVGRLVAQDRSVVEVG